MSEKDEPILTLVEAVTVSRMSRSSLYRIAEEGLKGGDSPFHKCRGKWLTTREDLVAWVRRQPGGNSDPMPVSTKDESVEDLFEQVTTMRKAA